VICVDASVAVKWVIEEVYSETATVLHDDTVRARESIVAPPLLPIEVTNVLWQRVRRRLLTHTQAEEALTRFLAFKVTLVSPATLHRDALDLAAAYTLPATYDAHYLALAQYLECDLWTYNQRFLKALGGQVALVRSLQAYQDGDRM
jgi:predicted nucleic acid-binding protein